MFYFVIANIKQPRPFGKNRRFHTETQYPILRRSNEPVVSKNKQPKCNDFTSFGKNIRINYWFRQKCPPLLKDTCHALRYKKTHEKFYLRFFKYFVFDLLASDRVQNMRKKIKISPTVAKFTGNIRIHTMIFFFHSFFFFVRLVVFET